MTIFGSIKIWNGTRGFGFLKRDDGQGDVFLHASALRTAGLDDPDIGDRFSFDVEPGRAGKTQAVNVRPA